MFAAAISLCFIAVCGRQANFGRGVGRNHKIPFKSVAFMFPMALDEARDGLVGAVNKRQSLNGIGLEGEVRG